MFLDFSLIKKLARFSLIVPKVLTFKGLVNKTFCGILIRRRPDNGFNNSPVAGSYKTTFL